MTIPALVLPMHRSLAGFTLVAHAHRATLNILSGKDTEHAAHADFFLKARTYLRDDQDVFLLVRGDEAMAWKQQRVPLVQRQAVLKETHPDIAGTLRRRAAAPLKPAAPQAPCDIGLFSDAAQQSDLVDYASLEVIPASHCRRERTT